ncbi:MAG: hypothetical protein J0I34_28175 [Pseudonocardia sp.]|uniref:hypothetical protein n=1 Tax=Pseudonocardia sp. TaxID=60912 RepID=UPI00086A8BFA|nr:hypothetical protein [Pseudonocardia sp.]MBN9112655.1 hypothetical protein [Pseudonocardia sp.]ODU19792.1 MAG: hypothetical protein ABS80_18930 [Pseudonocardia sp. SCN 72-51]
MSTIDLVGLIQRAVSAGVTGVLLSMGHLSPAGPVGPPPRADDSHSALPWEANPWDGMPWDGTPWQTSRPETPPTDPAPPDTPTDTLPWDTPPLDAPADPPPAGPPRAEPPRAGPPLIEPTPAAPKRAPDPEPRTTPPPTSTPPPRVPDTSARAEPPRVSTTTTRDTPIRAEEFDTAPPARDVRSAGRTSVRSGVLTLSGPAALCWTSARTHGRWGVRMRVPTAEGAVLLTGADPRAGEVRFADLAGTRASYAVRGDDGTTRGSTTIDATRRHTWTVEWTADAVVGLVDGKRWFRADASAALPQGPLFLCLQARQGATLEVDHVREYAPRR